MSFFIRNAGNNNRKRKPPPGPAPGGGGGKGGNKKSKKPLNNNYNPKKKVKLPEDDVIESDEEVPSDEGDVVDNDAASDVDAKEEDYETAQEKKVRLAKRLLEDLKAREEDKLADDALIHDAISHRLKSDLDDEKGRRVRPLADQLLVPLVTSISAADSDRVKVLNRNGKGHQRSVTCLVLSADSKWIFSAGKDARIVKWDVAGSARAGVIDRAVVPKKASSGGKKKKNDNSKETATAHSGIILCLAISTDFRFLASGDDNNLVFIWAPQTLSHLRTFKGHRGLVHGVAFRRNSSELFSCSADRCVKVWNCDQMSYVETLYGHQEAIMGVDSFVKERALTVGGTDATCRIWKIVEESQLVFAAGSSGSLDSLAFINEDYWVTGSDEGGLALWTVGKKKPLTQFAKAHSGINLRSEWTPDGVQPPGTHVHWISAVAAAPCSNLVASGSSDGHIRFWKCGEGFKHLTRLKFTVQVQGFVNSLKFSEEGSILVAGVGQEHRLGRWWRIAEAKNSICVVRLKGGAGEAAAVAVNGVKMVNGGHSMVNGIKEIPLLGDSDEDDEDDGEEDEDEEDEDEEDDGEEDEDEDDKEEDEEDNDDEEDGGADDYLDDQNDSICDVDNQNDGEVISQDEGKMDDGDIDDGPMTETKENEKSLIENPESKADGEIDDSPDKMDYGDSHGQSAIKPQDSAASETDLKAIDDPGELSDRKQDEECSIVCDSGNSNLNNASESGKVVVEDGKENPL